MREARRPVRRSGVVEPCGDPWGDGGRELELGDAYEGRHRQLVGRLTGAHAVQPHDATVTATELRAVVVMRSELVRLKMPVCDRVWVITVRFVHMLGRQRRRHGEPWRQNEADDEPAESMRHAWRLWLRTARVVKRFGLSRTEAAGVSRSAMSCVSQLGRMSAMVARRLVYRVHTLAPEHDRPPDRHPRRQELV